MSTNANCGDPRNFKRRCDCGVERYGDPAHPLYPAADPETKKIDSLQLYLGGLEQAEQRLEHFFSEGVYARKLSLPAGVIGIGKIHRTRHLNVILRGTAIVWTPEDGAVELKAPFVFVAEPGSRKVVYNPDDLEWLTIHGNAENVEDLDELERRLIVPHHPMTGMELAEELTPVLLNELGLFGQQIEEAA